MALAAYILDLTALMAPACRHSARRRHGVPRAARGRSKLVWNADRSGIWLRCDDLHGSTCCLVEHHTRHAAARPPMTCGASVCCCGTGIVMCSPSHQGQLIPGYLCAAYWFGPQTGKEGPWVAPLFTAGILFYLGTSFCSSERGRISLHTLASLWSPS